MTKVLMTQEGFCPEDMVSHQATQCTLRGENRISNML